MLSINNNTLNVDKLYWYRKKTLKMCYLCKFMHRKGTLILSVLIQFIHVDIDNNNTFIFKYFIFTMAKGVINEIHTICLRTFIFGNNSKNFWGADKWKIIELERIISNCIKAQFNFMYIVLGVFCLYLYYNFQVGQIHGGMYKIAWLII